MVGSRLGHGHGWGGGVLASLPPEARGQVGGGGGLFADSCEEREVLRKWGAREQAPQAAGGGPGAAVPEAGGPGGGRRRHVGVHRAGEEGQFGEAPAGL